MLGVGGNWYTDWRERRNCMVVVVLLLFFSNFPFSLVPNFHFLVGLCLLLILSILNVIVESRLWSCSFELLQQTKDGLLGSVNLLNSLFNRMFFQYVCFYEPVLYSPSGEFVHGKQLAPVLIVSSHAVCVFLCLFYCRQNTSNCCCMGASARWKQNQLHI